ncbi:MAG: S41 family peptidase, partial [Planctomycetota bacterium]
DDDMQPLFGPKGEYLYFASSRGGQEIFNIYRMPLTREVEQRDKEEEKEKEEDEEDEEEEEEEEEEKEEGKGEKGEEKKKEEKEEEKLEVKIDFEEIEDRVEPVTSTRGSDTLPVLDGEGETLYFKSNTLGHFEIWKSAVDGSSLNRLTRGKENPEEMVWSKEKKELIYRTGGTIRTLSGDGQAKGVIGYRAKMEIDLAAERREVFDEAWRALRDFFYDPSMHGVAWDRARRVYRPFVVDCACTEDFNDVFRMMLGELNASHLGIYGPGNDRKPEATAFTGMTLVPGRLGKRYVVAAVLKDSPAAREASKVEPGEFLVAVNRKEVRAGDNLSRILNGKVGEKMDFLFSLSEDGPGKRTVTFKPVAPGASSKLLYEAWVDGKRERVEKLGAGRLGYIHIRWMSRGAFRRFRREYLAKVREKDGLVLDVRNNPGGYIHNQLWELLSKRKPVGRFRIRGAAEELQPDHTWQKPVVLLINERSASDAEIFPLGFRTLGIGKVVGVPTWGGVIGTGGTSLANGAWLRLPYVGWYTHEGANLENYGVEPDVRVENHPEDDAAFGADAQLEKAVSLLLEQIKGK